MLRDVVRRGRALRDRLLLPEAGSGQEQWQRVVLNRAVGAHLDALGPEGLTAAEISGDAQARRPWKAFTSLNFPAFDLCAPTDRGQFDVVICEQVIEHVPDPFLAARTLHDLCVPGGHVVVSTPLMIRVHEFWGMEDYWRFTPRGLRTLLESAGLAVDEVGTWGNRRAIAGNLDRWPAYRPWHSLGNEPTHAMQVWAFARRAAAAR